MTKEELLNKYCTTLYRVDEYAFTEKEDAQKYLEAHLKYELRGYSHGVIHIPLADAEGEYDFDKYMFVDAMGSITGISYNDEEYDSLSYAYFDDDPTISSKDASEIESWVNQYKKLVRDIKKVLDSTYVSIDYSRDPERYDNYDFTITGSKSEVEELFYAMYGDEGWVEQESLTYSDEIDSNDFGDPDYLDIDFKGEYFRVR